MMSTTEGDLDVELSNELEDGELEDSDVEEGTYVPLARPEAFNPPSLVNMQIQDEQSDEDSIQESSGSESDDEPHRRPKRTKLRPRRPQPQTPAAKKDKYNIWCKALQEDLLTEDMVTCDLTKKSRYGVESCDCTIKYRLNDDYISKKVFTNNAEYRNKDQATNKRSNSDRGNVKLRLGKRVNSELPLDEKQAPRILPDLLVSLEDPLEQIANDIAEKLSEEKKEIVGRIVQVIGANKAMELYKQTQKVEAEGGMLVMNGTRRRTPGGIYFYLLKRDDDVSQSMVNKIFNEDRKETTRKIKRTRAKTRQKVMEQLKQSLTDSELPSLLSRGEATVQSEHGSNPPPSPATDARDGSGDTDALDHVDHADHVDHDAHIHHVDHDAHIDHVDHDAHIDHADHADLPSAPLPDRTTRALRDYEDDDFLEVMCNDDMDLF